MAKQYPFTLDPFQSTSVACLVGVESKSSAPMSSVCCSHHARFSRCCTLAGKARVCPCCSAYFSRKDSSSRVSLQLIMASYHIPMYLAVDMQLCRYAIAMAFRDNQKVIYTSPLKVQQSHSTICETNRLALCIA